MLISEIIDDIIADISAKKDKRRRSIFASEIWPIDAREAPDERPEPAKTVTTYCCGIPTIRFLE